MSRPILATDNRATIYHGTPLTPRAALTAVGTGRAMCVSFFRPDDVEVVEAISPTIMFRQRRVLRMDGSTGARRRILRSRRLDTFLSLVGAAAVRTWSMGSNPRCTWRSIPVERRVAERLAVWFRPRGTSLAYGRPDQSAGEIVRALSARCFGLDRAPETRAGRLRPLPPANGRGCATVWQSLAANSHDARYGRRLRLSIFQRGQHIAGAERPSLRLVRSADRYVCREHSLAGTAHVR